ncbi:hypothetical protein [Wolbachia endosymbiont of Nomada panzeri]|uniref:hypothetical protein n=1 Tax=Wolbachia endosymbiont of Nomada panzeri TaxID=1854760 RepID=UPI0012E8BC48|nr:hypothetical protein [Wolbachia endosymbiont of Nomada panzeri]
MSGHWPTGGNCSQTTTFVQLWIHSRYLLAANKQRDDEFVVYQIVCKPKSL